MGAEKRAGQREAQRGLAELGRDEYDGKQRQCVAVQAGRTTGENQWKTGLSSSRYQLWELRCRWNEVLLDQNEAKDYRWVQVES